MRSFLLLCCLCCLTAFPAAAAAPATGMRLGYVDLGRVLASAQAVPFAPAARPSPAGSPEEIRTAFGALSADWYDLRIRELDAPASATAVERTIESLQALLAPPPATAAAATPAAALMARVLQAVERVGREQNYLLIIEKSNLLFGHPSADVTDAVIAVLQEPAR